MIPPHGAIALDSCCLLNLYASGHFAAIAAALPHRLVIADRVQAEALWVRRGGTGDDADARDLVDTATLVAASTLSVVVLAPPELADFVRFAAEVDDGEAATAALALHRGYDVATDDGKARRLLRTHVPHAHLYSTLDMLKHWADTSSVPAADLRAVLTAVRDRASFLPPKRDELRSWAESILAAPPPTSP